MRNCDNVIIVTNRLRIIRHLMQNVQYFFANLCKIVKCIILCILETVKYLLEDASESLDGAPVNYSNRDGRTCLHIAALKDNLALAVYLVERHHADKSLKWRYKVSSFFSTSLMKLSSKNT